MKAGRKNNFTTSNIYFMCVVLLLSFTQNLFAQPYSMVRYVRVDHAAHTAYIYDEQFNKLQDSPYIAGGSIEYLPEGKTLWYLGSAIDMIRRNNNGSIDILSDNSNYTEMNHHFTFVYYTPNRTYENCNDNMPIASGSELTDFHMPAGYAYKMDGGFINTGAWHWSNPANIDTAEEIYLRFVFELDDNPAGYKDTNVSWIDTVPCQSDFSIPHGKFTSNGPDYKIANKRRIVGVLPHIHDHSKSLELRRNGEKIRKFKPDNANIYVAHDDVGDGAVPLHTSDEHLPTEGLSAWTPGINGPIVSAGDLLNIRAKFNNPHQQSIDNMAIMFVYWEDLSQ